jgi:hypothetical protein
MKPAKSRWSLFVALAALAATTALPAFAQHPSAQEERSRLLLIFAPDENNKQLQDQYAQLQRDMDQMDAQDVDVLYVIGDHTVKLPPPDMKTVSGDELRKHYHVDANGFRVVLVGKDGWEKSRWSEPTPAKMILNHAQDMPRPKSQAEKK